TVWEDDGTTRSPGKNCSPSRIVNNKALALL
ncbi:MAG: hypothetical protein ACI9LN_004657, partial [Saprospiraceae bacterium]